MTHSDFYNLATSLPLLQGISAEHILQMQERGALRLVSMEPEEGDIILEGQHCNTLTMLMAGTLACTTKGEGWTLLEEIHAPAIIEEEALWNLSQKYGHTYRPLTNGHLLVIDRRHVMQTMMHNDIFRINLLTRMAARLEHHHFATLKPTPHSVQEKIMHFIREKSHTNTLPKRLFIKMNTLATIIGETRLKVSIALHQMQEDSLLTLSREQITFNER